jgi:hypothetical protein
MARERARSASSWYEKSPSTFIPSDFSDTLPSHPPFFQPVSFPAAPAYPVGSGSAQMRRSVAANTRRVRWLSANRSQ